MGKPDQSLVDSRTKPVWKDSVFWFLVALGLGYGAVFNFLPATFPIFKREFGSTLEQMGQTQFLFFVSSVVFGAIGGPIIGRLGLRRSAMVAVLIIGVTLLVIGGAQKFSLVLVSAFFFGLAIAAVVVIISSIISGHFGDKRQSVFFLSALSDAGGSMMGPAVLGWWFVQADRLQMSWRSGYYVGAGVMGVLLLWALFVRSESMQGDGSGTKAGDTALSVMAEVLRNPVIYVASFLGFFHGLALGGMLSFVGQLYQSKLQIDAARAAYFLSVNAGGVLGGRLLFSWITSRWRPPELLVVAVCAAGETCAFVATIHSPSYLLGISLFTLSGIFVSSIGPSLSSYLGGRCAGRTATAFSLFIGLGGIGTAVGPYLIGTVGYHLGVHKGILFGPVSSAMLSIVAFLWFFREK